MKKKSPGYDGISIEHLQHVRFHLSRILAMFYPFCLRHSNLPDECTKTVVFPILKNKTGLDSDISNYRPISPQLWLTSQNRGKKVEYFTAHILSSHIKLNDAQFGFGNEFLTETVVLRLKHTIRNYTDKKTPLYTPVFRSIENFDWVSFSMCCGIR